MRRPVYKADLSLLFALEKQRQQTSGVFSNADNHRNI